MITIEQAIVLATTAMQGLKDLEGNAAILHPLRVMLSGKSDDEKIVGVLHDVPEDTNVGFSQLKEAGCTDAQIEALHFLTHSKDVPYFVVNCFQICIFVSDDTAWKLYRRCYQCNNGLLVS